MKLALIGFSDLGHYIKDMLLDFHNINESDIIYFDDNLYNSNQLNSKPFKEYKDEAFKDFDFYVCLGYKYLNIKNEILDNLRSIKRNTPYFIHPSAYVHPSVKIGNGSFIYPGCSIDRNTIIGNGVWIANGGVIAHDCKIDNCCWFGASVTLSGKVSIAQNTFIGSGSTVSNDVNIGSDVIIGLGSVITKNIDNEQSVIGNPMRILEKKLKLI